MGARGCAGDCGESPAQAQTPPRPAVEAARRPCPASGTRGDGRIGPICRGSTVIRFLTETDYPPFNFTGADGNPAGFNVDLARAICEEIKVTCTIQMRRFETLVDALSTNRGDAIIASLAVTPEMRAKSISPIPITARRRASCRGAMP